jgi:hypothetical protein
VLDALGWESETEGHLYHGIYSWLLKNPIFYNIDSEEKNN